VLAVVCSAVTPGTVSADGIQTAGDALQVVLPASAAVTALGLRDRPGVWQLVGSEGLAVGTTLVLKSVVDETRPDGGPHSFPSGHTSNSFAAAEFMRHRYGWRIGLPAYAAAAFVGYSRVESHNHYTHDVLAGAAIGIGSSLAFTRPYHGWKAHVAGASHALELVAVRGW
jgi:membrane-associated phospholipid phosphatase